MGAELQTASFASWRGALENTGPFIPHPAQQLRTTRKLLWLPGAQNGLAPKDSAHWPIPGPAAPGTF